MGIKFGLNQINLLSHLVNGDINSYLNELLNSNGSYEDYQKNKKCLKDFVFGFNKNFRSDEHKDIDVEKTLDDIDKIFNISKNEYEKIKYKRMDVISPNMYPILDKLFQILSRAKFKAVLFPSPEKDLKYKIINQKLCSENTLIELLTQHPGKSCLIMQPDEIPKKEDVFLFTAFKHFELAYRNIDLWPGVLLWDNKRVAFVPIKSIEELFDLFKELRCVSKESSFKWNKVDHFFDELEYKMDVKRDYIIHISDLHIGRDGWEQREKQLLTLLTDEKIKINKENVNASIKVIITGDLTQTPNEENDDSRDEFIEKIKNFGISNDISFVYGNHDIKLHGFIPIVKKPKYSEFCIENKVIKDDKTKTIYIGINSNEDGGGALAKGEIKGTQTTMLSEELNNLTNVDGYNRIAILHHHAIPIEPTKWLNRFFGPIIKDWGTVLKDSETFAYWLRKENIDIVLHGHKHTPRVFGFDQSKHIGCGSSTGYTGNTNNTEIGRINNSDAIIENGDFFISYNVISYNPKTSKPAVCTLYFVDVENGSARHLQTYKL